MSFSNSKFFLLFAFVLFVISFSFVSFATADEIAPTVATQSVIPGSVSCEMPAVFSLKTYEYDGSLHSFGFTVNDVSQVALAVSVGENALPFHYVTRTNTGENSGTVMFVNTPTTPVGESLQVSVTMLSAKGAGAPVCLTMVSFALHGSAALTRSAPVATVSAGEVKAQSAWGGATLGGIFSSIVEGGERILVGGALSKDTAQNESENGSAFDRLSALAGSGESESILAQTGVAAAAQDAAARTCVPERGATRLWMLLLALYAVGAFVIHSRRGRLFGDQMFTNAVLLIPFLVLVAFWYYVPECRVGWWTLAVGVAIAFVALSGKFYLKPPTNKKDNPWTAFHP